MGGAQWHVGPRQQSQSFSVAVVGMPVFPEVWLGWRLPTRPRSAGRPESARAPAKQLQHQGSNTQKRKEVAASKQPPDTGAQKPLACATAALPAKINRRKLGPATTATTAHTHAAHSAEWHEKQQFGSGGLSGASTATCFYMVRNWHLARGCGWLPALRRACLSAPLYKNNPSEKRIDAANIGPEMRTPLCTGLFYNPTVAGCVRPRQLAGPAFLLSTARLFAIHCLPSTSHSCPIP